jgi:hypothetical protein
MAGNTHGMSKWWWLAFVLPALGSLALVTQFFLSGMEQVEETVGGPSLASSVYYLSYKYVFMITQHAHTAHYQSVAYLNNHPSLDKPQVEIDEQPNKNPSSKLAYYWHTRLSRNR